MTTLPQPRGRGKGRIGVELTPLTQPGVTSNARTGIGRGLKLRKSENEASTNPNSSQSSGLKMSGPIFGPNSPDPGAGFFDAADDDCTSIATVIEASTRMAKIEIDTPILKSAKIRGYALDLNPEEEDGGCGTNPENYSPVLGYLIQQRDQRQHPVRDHCRVGRQEDCQVRLVDLNVSRNHAVILKYEDRIVIRPVSEKKGVAVNQTRFNKGQETNLEDGDKIKIGREIFVWRKLNKY